MDTRIKRSGGQVHFMIVDVVDKYHDVLRDLFYSDCDEGFIKSFPEGSLYIEQASHNFQRYAEEIILQSAGERPVPWDRALLTFLGVIDNLDFNWWLCGSAALAVRGLAIQPRDVDLVVMEDGAPRLAHVLRDYLVEPVMKTQDWISDWFARAFIHCRFEWIGTPYEAVDADGPSDFGPLAASRLETIHWQDHPIKVPSLDLQLATCRRRGLDQRAKLIEVALLQGM